MKDIIKPVRFSKEDIKMINKGIKLVSKATKENVSFGTFIRSSALHNAELMVLAEGVDN